MFFKLNLKEKMNSKRSSLMLTSDVAWTEEEDKLLVELVHKLVVEEGYAETGLKLFDKIAPKFPGRTGQVLRKRYHKTLNNGPEKITSQLETPPLVSQIPVPGKSKLVIESSPKTHPSKPNKRKTLEAPKLGDSSKQKYLEIVSVLQETTGRSREVVLYGLYAMSGDVLKAYRYLKGGGGEKETAWSHSDDIAILSRDAERVVRLLETRTVDEISARFDYVNALCDAP